MTWLVLSLCLGGCGGSAKGGGVSRETKGVNDETKRFNDETKRFNDGATDEDNETKRFKWWQGETLRCGSGKLRTRNLSWGRIHWCELPGLRVDANLQNDLGRLARCIHESISAFQEEPEPDKLGLFLARAQDAGLNPVLCGAVRRDSEVRTYSGRTVIVDRVMLSEDLMEDGGGEMRFRYRFGCDECLVASEMTVTVAIEGKP